MLKAKLFTAVLVFLMMGFSIGVDADPRSRGGHFSGHPHSHSYSHPSFGFYLGLPLYPRPYYPYYPNYYPYYPPQIVPVPVNPPVYIERSAPQPARQLPAGYWYYCSSPEGYYPYVKECPSGWRQVDPIPPSPR